MHGGVRTTSTSRALNTLYSMSLKEVPLVWKKVAGDGKLWLCLII